MKCVCEAVNVACAAPCRGVVAHGFAAGSVVVRQSRSSSTQTRVSRAFLRVNQAASAICLHSARLRAAVLPRARNRASSEPFGAAPRRGATAYRTSTTLPLTVVVTVVRPSATGSGTDSSAAARAIIIVFGSGPIGPEPPIETSRTS